MSSVSSQFRSVPHYATASIAGLVFAFVVSQALALEMRYLVAFFGGVVLLSLGMTMAGNIRDVLLYVLAFNLPFTSIEKGLLIVNQPTFQVRAIAVGLTDLCLFSLYALWAASIFVSKKEDFPRFTKLDWWVLAFVAVHAVSLLNAASPVLTFFEIVRLGKYALLYFYVAHQVRRRHLKWIVAGILFAILLEGSLGVVQQKTGALMGLGNTKGDSGMQYQQWVVPGIEDIRRAEGTAFDSHALGLFFAMTLPIPLVLTLTPQLRTRYRLLTVAVLAFGSIGLVITLSRGSWLAFGCATLFVIWCLARWRQWKSIVLAGIVGVMMTAAIVIPFAGWIRQRLFEAPPDLMTTRYETLSMAIDIWRSSPWIGVGANGYMVALGKVFSIFEGEPYFIPAHNLVAMILAELGLIGFSVFLVLSFVVIVTGWRVSQSRDPLLRSLGGALLAGFAALQIEGITDPIYITNVTYFLFWFELGLIAALYAMCWKSPAMSTIASNFGGRAEEPVLAKAGQC